MHACIEPKHNDKCLTYEDECRCDDLPQDGPESARPDARHGIDVMLEALGAVHPSHGHTLAQTHQQHRPVGREAVQDLYKVQAAL